MLVVVLQSAPWTLPESVTAFSCHSTLGYWGINTCSLVMIKSTRTMENLRDSKSDHLYKVQYKYFVIVLQNAHTTLSRWVEDTWKMKWIIGSHDIYMTQASLTTFLHLTRLVGNRITWSSKPKVKVDSLNQGQLKLHDSWLSLNFGKWKVSDVSFIKRSSNENEFTILSLWHISGVLWFTFYVLHVQ